MRTGFFRSSDFVFAVIVLIAFTLWACYVKGAGHYRLSIHTQELVRIAGVARMPKEAAPLLKSNAFSLRTNSDDLGLSTFFYQDSETWGNYDKNNGGAAFEIIVPISNIGVEADFGNWEGPWERTRTDIPLSISTPQGWSVTPSECMLHGGSETVTFDIRKARP